MRSIDLIHRGRHVAAGYIIDPQVIGLEIARRRVLEQWTSGVTLRVLADGSWLLLFSEPVQASAERSPGTLVVAVGNGLVVAPDLAVTDGHLVRWVHGALESVAIDQLPALDPSDWIDPVHRTIRLEPLEAPVASRVVTDIDPPPPTPDLRAAAKVRELSRPASKFRSELNQQAASNSSPRTRRRSGQAGPRSAKRISSGTIAKLILRTPIRNEIGRRHARYLDELGKQFRTGKFDQALRNAIPIGGLGGGAWTLRLPAPREQLRISAHGPGHARTVPFGVTVSQHLTEVYQNAAKELEGSGRIDEAAFVLAELLGNASLCVALLERHKRYTLAATLAENRNLPPPMRVRLWWLAAGRDRAIRIARQHNVFAAVITQLEDTDPAAARDLRLAWVDQLERSGDLGGAVSAGWPDKTIRPLLVNVIERGLINGGQRAIGLLAYRAALHPSEEHRNALFSTLEDQAVAAGTVRTIAIAVADARADDPIADREMASRTARALTRIVQPPSDKQLSAAVRAIRQRADPLLVADLPQPITWSAEAATVLIGEHLPGNVEIHDAVPLGDGTTILALGELGCRLLTADGRIKAKWDVPCHHLVPADHSGFVALLTAREPSFEVHILELATRRPRYYGNITASLWAANFDGLSWPIVDLKGIAYLDLLADRPTVAWRELERAWICHQLVRSNNALAAIITVQGPRVVPGVEVWRWDLPDRRLRTRHRIEPVVGATSLHLLTDGTSIWERQDSGRVAAAISGDHTAREAIDTTIAATDQIATSGLHLARRTADGRLIITEGPGGDSVVEVERIDGKWGFRVHGNLVAIWDAVGRYFVVDLDIGQVQVTGRALL